MEVHPLIVESRLWRNEEDTRLFAQRLALQPGLQQAFIELDGELGAGKTTLVRHLLRALGVTGRVKSPTYAVVEPYQVGPLSIWHFDFYRFNDPREWEDAGFRDLFAAPGLKLAEWSDKARTMLPQPDLRICLQSNEDESRQVELSAFTPTGQELLR